MPNTPFLDLPYPNENDDPFFEQIVAFFDAVDQDFYALLASSSPVMGGGVITLTPTSISPPRAILSWSQPFEFMIPGSGFFLQAPFGPDSITPQISLEDGDRVIVTVPIISGGNVQANISKINGAVVNSQNPIPGLLTLGVFRNGTFYSNLPRNPLSVFMASIRSGTVPILSGSIAVSVIFSSPMGSANYAPNPVFVNTVDVDPIYQPINITAFDANGFTASWNAPLDSSNYSLQYSAIPFQ